MRSRGLLRQSVHRSRTVGPSRCPTRQKLGVFPHRAAAGQRSQFSPQAEATSGLLLEGAHGLPEVNEDIDDALAFTPRYAPSKIAERPGELAAEVDHDPELNLEGEPVFRRP